MGLSSRHAGGTHPNLRWLVEWCLPKIFRIQHAEQNRSCCPTHEGPSSLTSFVWPFFGDLRSFDSYLWQFLSFPVLVRAGFHIHSDTILLKAKHRMLFSFLSCFLLRLGGGGTCFLTLSGDLVHLLVLSRGESMLGIKRICKEHPSPPSPFPFNDENPRVAERCLPCHKRVDMH